MPKPKFAPMRETAGARIRSIAKEIGDEYNSCQHGWIAEASRQLGIPYRTLYYICAYTKPTSDITVEKICRKIGCTPNDIMGD